MKNRWWQRLSVWSLVAALVATGCGASGGDDASATSQPAVRANQGLVENADPPREGGKLVYGLNSESNGWNPSTNQWAAAGLIVAHTIFDTLTAFDAESGVRPFLAERFDHSEDFRTWTFTLRRDVLFSNGKPANAEAVARGQNVLKASPVTGQVYRTVESITATDDVTVVFALSEPFVQFPMVMATQVGVVADPDWMASNDGLQPVGTGPFQLESWNVDDQLTVTKNPNYWQTDSAGNRLPYLDEIQFRTVPDDLTRGAALRAGDLDAMQTAGAVQLQEFLADQENFQVLAEAGDESQEVFVQLNSKVEPFDDVNARRALAYATNTDEYTDLVTAGVDGPATGFLESDSPWYTGSTYPGFDPAKARELVEQVKADHGQFSMVLIGPAGDSTVQLALQLLQQQWSAVGIDVRIELQEQASMIINVVTGNYQASFWAQFDAPNPILDRIWWEPSGALAPPEFSLNFARYGDPAIGDALREAAATEDPDEFRAQLAVISQRFDSEVPYIWLNHQSFGAVASKRVVNLGNYTLPDGSVGMRLLQGSHPLAQVWLEG